MTNQIHEISHFLCVSTIGRTIAHVTIATNNRNGKKVLRKAQQLSQPKTYERYLDSQTNSRHTPNCVQSLQPR